jgi:outer membrane protein TolC
LRERSFRKQRFVERFFEISFAMKLLRNPCSLQRSILYRVSPRALAGISLLFLQPAIGQQPTPQTNPAIPQAEQPTATPSPEPQLPTGPKEETKPLIPAAGSPTPSPTPALAADVQSKLDQEFEAALQVHRFRPNFFAPLSLLDAVRLTLMQNSDLRMSTEDAQSARGALKKATGNYDSQYVGALGYTRTQLSNSNSANSVSAFTTQNQINQVLTQTLTQTLTELKANPGANISQLVTTNAALSSGSASTTDVQNVIATIDASKTLRNGMDVSVEYSPQFLNSQDQLAWPPAIHQITFSMGIPLTKFGTYFNSADETAARKDYQAALLTVGHTTTKAVLDAINAYWKEAGALEKFYIADRTYRVNTAVLSLTEELAKSGGVAQTEVPLALAHRAEAFAARSAALIEVLNTAKNLSETLGLTRQQLRLLPFPSDGFPGVSGPALSRIDESRMIDIALARRLDRLAAIEKLDGKRVKSDHARIDLRPDIKLSLGGGADIIDGRQTGTPGGGYSVDPQVNANVSLNWTPANNKKEGALLAAEADLDKAAISLDDISRDIELSVQNDIDTIQEYRVEISQSDLAAENYQKTVTDLREKFRLGAATLLDVFQGVAGLDKSAAALVDAKSSLAATIAKLRYDTATMLTRGTVMRTPGFPNPVEKMQLKRDAFVTLPDLNQEAGPTVKDRNYEPNIKYISGHPPWHH